MQKFGNISLGIHGKELPKYSDSTPDREYWKNYNGYANSPIHQSAKLLKMGQNLYSKPDLFLMSQYNESQQPPID
jgi:hypothetical protein